MTELKLIMFSKDNIYMCARVYDFLMLIYTLIKYINLKPEKKKKNNNNKRLLVAIVFRSAVSGQSFGASRTLVASILYLRTLNYE